MPDPAPRRRASAAYPIPVIAPPDYRLAPVPPSLTCPFCGTAAPLDDAVWLQDQSPQGERWQTFHGLYECPACGANLSVHASRRVPRG